jgi:hypothetical protein
MLSDGSKHNSIQVHAFQQQLMQLIENTSESLLKHFVYLSVWSAT